LPFSDLVITSRGEVNVFFYAPEDSKREADYCLGEAEAFFTPQWVCQEKQMDKKSIRLFSWRIKRILSR